MTEPNQKIENILSYDQLEKTIHDKNIFIDHEIIVEEDKFRIEVKLEKYSTYLVMLGLIEENKLDYHLAELYKRIDNLDDSHSVIFILDQACKFAKLDLFSHSPLCYFMELPFNINNLKIAVHSLQKMQAHMQRTRKESLSVTKKSEDVKNVLSISRELNGVRDIPRLLRLILKKVREVTRADAGSIYTLNSAEQDDLTKGTLKFEYTQNDSMQQTLTSFEVPINDKSIVGNAVIHSCPINIPDLYKLSSNPDDNPFGVIHDRSWDIRTGYQSRSMLTVPLYDISHTIIGVVQLINAKKDWSEQLLEENHFEDNVVPFSDDLVEYAMIVAQQAGIALENAKMQLDIQRLFDSFVNASVTAIELRDPTTSGHSHRVAALTLELAKNINIVEVGNFKDINFNEDQMREIRYASLLHDFGKLAVRENVLVKAKKLYPDEFRLIQERFQLIKSCIEVDYYRNMLKFEGDPASMPMGFSKESLEAEKDKKVREIDYFFDFICKANEPTVLEQGGFELLKDIANCSFIDPSGSDRPYIIEAELKALSVSRGSLTASEFAQIQSHVEHTYEFLRKIPWGDKLMNVPQIAAKHHEKLDGSGYPNSAHADEIPIQSRMMTISDIYDALTAADRPYKKAMPAQRALDILQMEVNGGKIDKSIFDIFVDSKSFKVVEDT